LHILKTWWQFPPFVPITELGAFRLTTLPGHLLADDPLVYPGKPGAAHLHQFFGNTKTNAYSTYTSLRTTGGSTFETPTADGASVQRTAYWVPAMLDGAGNAVKPDWMNTYYKRHAKTASFCNGMPDANHLGICVDMPNGLRFIVGYNMSTGLMGPNDLVTLGAGNTGFDCHDRTTYTSLTGLTRTIAAMVGRCPAGAWLRAYLNLPNCWDGKNLDSPDHRSHLAYALGPVGVQGIGWSCPTTHPYVIPQIALSIHYTTDSNFTAGRWHFSSDEMIPGIAAGSTLHADYWEAWSPVAKKKWQTNCLDAPRSCSSFEYGDGTFTPGGSPAGGWPIQPKVPLSSIPKTP
jgi:hypothetical protein